MIEKSLKDKTAKGLFWGGISNILQQILNLFFGIFLARLLSPADYGMVGVLSIFTFIATSIQEGGFSTALANKKIVNHKEYNAVFWFNAIMGFCLYWMLFFIAPLIANFFKLPELVALARYNFLIIIISCIGTVHYAYIFRNLMVKQNAYILLISLVISGTAGVIMAFHKMAYWGIATQSIINSICTTSLRWYFSKWRPSFRIDFRPLKGMIRFSIKILITNIILHINYNFLTIIMGRFYTVKDVGYFTQSQKWNLMGYSTIQGMVQGVAQPVLHEAGDSRERQNRVFRKMLRFVSFISFPCLLGLSLIAPELITIAITDKWSKSISLLEILCIAGSFIPIQNLYSNLLISHGKSGVYMTSTFLLCSLQFIAALLAHNYGIKTMVICYTAIYIGWTFIWHFTGGKLIKLSLWNAIKDVLPFFLTAIGVMLITKLIVNQITNNIYISLIGKILIAAILYIGVMRIFRVKTLQDTINYIFKQHRTAPKGE